MVRFIIEVEVERAALRSGRWVEGGGSVIIFRWLPADTRNFQRRGFHVKSTAGLLSGRGTRSDTESLRYEAEVFLLGNFSFTYVGCMVLAVRSITVNHRMANSDSETLPVSSARNSRHHARMPRLS